MQINQAAVSLLSFPCQIILSLDLFVDSSVHGSYSSSSPLSPPTPLSFVRAKHFHHDPTVRESHLLFIATDSTIAVLCNDLTSLGGHEEMIF